MQRLLRVHRAAREHHVGRHAVPAHLEQAGDAAGVGDHAVRHLREHEARLLAGDADVAQQRALEARADGPPLHRHEDRHVQLEHLPYAGVRAISS